jgi:hypothetical protein
MTARQASIVQRLARAVIVLVVCVACGLGWWGYRTGDAQAALAGLWSLCAGTGPTR